MLGYNPLTGVTSNYRDNTANLNLASGVDLISMNGARFNSSGSTTGNVVYIQWTADARF
jgi:hypothetical protein